MNVYGIAVVGDGLRQIDIEGTEKKFYKLDDIKEAKFAVYPRKSNRQEANRLADPSTQSEGMPVLAPEKAVKQQGYKIESYKEELKRFKEVLKQVEEYAAKLAKGEKDSEELYVQCIKPLLDDFFKGCRQSTKVELKELLEGIRKNYRIKKKKEKEKMPELKQKKKPEPKVEEPEKSSLDAESAQEPTPQAPEQPQPAPEPQPPAPEQPQPQVPASQPQQAPAPQAQSQQMVQQQQAQPQQQVQMQPQQQIPIEQPQQPLQVEQPAAPEWQTPMMDQLIQQGWQQQQPEEQQNETNEEQDSGFLID